MSFSRKKKLLAGLLLLLIAGACIGFYFYNKGPVNIKNASAKNVEAAALYHAFATDSVAAQKNYSGKILVVSGTVSQTIQNQNGSTVIMLNSGNNSGFINCTLEQGTPAGIKQDQFIQIKGMCSGMGQADADLGIEPDLYLERCILQK